MTSYLPNLARDNLSYYTIPIALVVALAPRMYAANAYKAATNKPVSEKVKTLPRSFNQIVSDDPAVDSKTKARILRAGAAVDNSLENLGIFAAAVTAGNAAGVGAGRMNALRFGAAADEELGVYDGGLAVYGYVCAGGHGDECEDVVIGYTLD
ncbi:hypothetical protein LTR91_008890 [Friedmanniomyces endolithicus]|uniref:Uncharacterized protein n=1 Tax=Friedmanniomyces endolithicus TaxID=329885 RepID=A0AAN6KMF0_9PEZI|nr:hypothetical protein LTR94_013650 [Friedmanniomyces endolithicus]KAK0778155.1 hypothetical protein LTR59_013599 [Friedmanniomyces endolithicus]KAK0784271.1 hypothetical protein LTR38_012733 [Friedmanniomyces endolithicus]KAK0796785.1 hypothetical protein LTR75_010086 [Friedmanniomyces endolithicus]KAK0855336.1 hypothetical protein LTR03_001786 [Friedmanniomyces endolithicus]